MTPPVVRSGVNSPESRLARSSRADIYYETYGEGPALLFIPGAFDNIIGWSFNIPHFVAAGYRVLAMNLRGHFMSPCHDGDLHFRHHADDIAAVLDAEGIDRVAILASSFGGFGAIRFALAQPDRTAALILSGSTAGVYSDQAFDGNKQAVDGFDAAIRAGVKLSASFAPTTRPHAFLWRQINQLGTLDGGLACSFLAVRTMLDQDAWLRPDDLVEYRTPTFLIGGDNDALLPPGFQRETARLIPGAELSPWSATGHIPFWEDPERYNTEAQRFLDQAGWRAAPGTSV